MNKEIKEILDKLNNKAEHYILYDYEVKQLLDHITNLQKYYNYNVNKYEELILKYSNLQEENEILKDLKYFTTDEIYKELGKRLQECADVSEELASECNDKQERMDNAIELIKKDREKNYDTLEKKAFYCNKTDKLLNILQGDDKNDNR